MLNISSNAETLRHPNSDTPIHLQSFDATERKKKDKGTRSSVG